MTSRLVSPRLFAALCAALAAACGGNDELAATPDTVATVGDAADSASLLDAATDDGDDETDAAEADTATADRGPADAEDAAPDLGPPPPTPAWAGAPPADPGPFPVGVRTIYFDDDDRVVDFEGTLGLRRLPIEIWYPAAESARGQPEAIVDLEAEAPPEVLALLGDTPIPEVPAGGVRDAAPRAGDGPYPLIVFSHGNGGVRMQSVFLTRHLASHGYVVAAPDHVGDTLFDLLLAGGIEETELLQSGAERPLDVSATIDALLALSADDADPLFGLLEPRWIGVSGHSFGGFTSLGLTARGAWFGDPRRGGERVDVYDARVRAVIPLAPFVTLLPLMHAYEHNIDIPILFAVGDADGTLPPEQNAVRGYERAKPPKALLTIHGGGHFTFTDLCDFDLVEVGEAVGANVNNVLGDGCSEEFADHKLSLRATARAMTAFLDAALLGHPTAASGMDPLAEPDLAAIATLASEGLVDP